ncbi:unnamed protein product, partial [Choristocarpus tenellus]
GGECILQQDNAPIHVSKVTKEWFQEHDIHVLEWPPKSSDLNPMDNLWGIMAHKVYAHGKQYSSCFELMECAKKAWDNIEVETMEKLVSSMTKRCIQVIERKGAKTSY